MHDDLLAEQRRDCFIEREGYWFRVRAAAVIIRDGHVLMARNDRDPYYYSVGGAVMLGESLEDALRREVLEETGIDMAIDRLLFIHENFFPGHNGLQCHELAFYYLMKLPEHMAISTNSHSMHGATEHMAWLSISRYADYDAYPRFFAEYLTALPEHPLHILSRE